MNDFLKQLRSGGGKRFDRNRRPYEGPSQYRGTDRNNHSRDRKNTPHRKNYDQGQLQAMKKILETIAEQQTSLANLSKRQVLATERIAKVLETVASQIGFTVDENKPLPLSSAPEAESLAETETTLEVKTEPAALPQKSTTASETLEKGRESVLKMISDRRSEGDAFDKIAEFLEKEHVPTLSGKGKWRAQSVSRLFNQAAQQDR